MGKRAKNAVFAQWDLKVNQERMVLMAFLAFLVKWDNLEIKVKRAKRVSLDLLDLMDLRVNQVVMDLVVDLEERENLVKRK